MVVEGWSEVGSGGWCCQIFDTGRKGQRKMREERCKRGRITAVFESKGQVTRRSRYIDKERGMDVK
jgi:hypothetical protein